MSALEDLSAGPNLNKRNGRSNVSRNLNSQSGRGRTPLNVLVDIRRPGSLTPLAPNKVNIDIDITLYLYLGNGRFNLVALLVTFIKGAK